MSHCPYIDAECSCKSCLRITSNVKLFILAPQFSDVQRHVANITDGKILVGHSIRNDLKVKYFEFLKCLYQCKYFSIY